MEGINELIVNKLIEENNLTKYIKEYTGINNVKLYGIVSEYIHQLLLVNQDFKNDIIKFLKTDNGNFLIDNIMSLKLFPNEVMSKIYFDKLGLKLNQFTDKGYYYLNQRDYNNGLLKGIFGMSELLTNYYKGIQREAVKELIEKKFGGENSPEYKKILYIVKNNFIYESKLQNEPEDIKEKYIEKNKSIFLNKVYDYIFKKYTLDINAIVQEKGKKEFYELTKGKIELDLDKYVGKNFYEIGEIIKKADTLGGYFKNFIKKITYIGLLYSIFNNLYEKLYSLYFSLEKDNLEKKIKEAEKIGDKELLKKYKGMLNSLLEKNKKLNEIYKKSKLYKKEYEEFIKEINKNDYIYSSVTQLFNQNMSFVKKDIFKEDGNVNINGFKFNLTEHNLLNFYLLKKGIYKDLDFFNSIYNNEIIQGAILNPDINGDNIRKFVGELSNYEGKLDKLGGGLYKQFYEKIKYFIGEIDIIESGVNDGIFGRDNLSLLNEFILDLKKLPELLENIKANYGFEYYDKKIKEFKLKKSDVEEFKAFVESSEINLLKYFIAQADIFNLFKENELKKKVLELNINSFLYNMFLNIKFLGKEQFDYKDILKIFRKISYNLFDGKYDKLFSDNGLNVKDITDGYKKDKYKQFSLLKKQLEEFKYGLKKTSKTNNEQLIKILYDIDTDNEFDINLLGLLYGEAGNFLNNLSDVINDALDYILILENLDFLDLDKNNVYKKDFIKLLKKKKHLYEVVNVSYQSLYNLFNNSGETFIKILQDYFEKQNFKKKLDEYIYKFVDVNIQNDSLGKYMKDLFKQLVNSFNLDTSKLKFASNFVGINREKLGYYGNFYYYLFVQNLYNYFFMLKFSEEFKKFGFKKKIGFEQATMEKILKEKYGKKHIERVLDLFKKLDSVEISSEQLEKFPEIFKITYHIHNNINENLKLIKEGLIKNVLGKIFVYDKDDFVKNNFLSKVIDTHFYIYKIKYSDTISLIYLIYILLFGDSNYELLNGFIIVNVSSFIFVLTNDFSVKTLNSIAMYLSSKYKNKKHLFLFTNTDIYQYIGEVLKNKLDISGVSILTKNIIETFYHYSEITDLDFYGINDLNISRIKFRVGGTYKYVSVSLGDSEQSVFTFSEIERFIMDMYILGATISDKKSVDTEFTIGGIAFRTNIARDGNDVSISIRKTKHISKKFEGLKDSEIKKKIYDDYGIRFGEYKIIVDKGKIKLEDAYEKDDVEIFKSYSAQDRGLFVICGKTRSGKSTSLFNLMDYIFESNMKKNKEPKIFTLEDPIEIRNPNYNQIKVESDPKEFQQMLKAIKRQDPDVVLVGETRDYTTMFQISEIANMTSTFTTFHVTNPLSAIMQLNSYAKQNGVSLMDYLFIMRMIVSQKLISTIKKDKLDEVIKRVGIHNIDGLKDEGIELYTDEKDLLDNFIYIVGKDFFETNLGGLKLREAEKMYDEGKLQGGQKDYIEGFKYFKNRTLELFKKQGYIAKELSSKYLGMRLFYDYMTSKYINGNLEKLLKLSSENTPINEIRKNFATVFELKEEKALNWFFEGKLPYSDGINVLDTEFYPFILSKMAKKTKNKLYNFL